MSGIVLGTEPLSRKSCRRFFRYERQAGTHCSHSTPRLQRNGSYILVPCRDSLRVFHAQPISTLQPTEQGLPCPSFYYQDSDPGARNSQRIRISNFGFSSLLAPDLRREIAGSCRRNSSEPGCSFWISFCPIPTASTSKLKPTKSNTSTANLGFH